MKIALIGTRGVPARYGGFETCAEEIGWRLAANGHEVLAYCRKGIYSDKRKFYRGMKLIYLAEIKIKSIETISHTFLSILDAIARKTDVLLVFNVANSPLLLIPLLFRRKFMLNVDGFEWRRSKWSPLGQRYYKFAAWLASRLNCELIADSQEIKRYYKEKYGRKLRYIAYGAYPQRSINSTLLARFGLKPGEYFLQITRFEPENNPLLSIEAFRGLKTDKKLVLVGGALYKTEYASRIMAFGNDRIILPGFIYDQDMLRELLCNCLAYIHGNEVGGTNPSLLAAMASGCFVISRDVIFNREVLKDGGVYFQKGENDLREKLQWALENSHRNGQMAEKGRALIKQNYDWDSVVAEYEELLNGES